MGDSISKKKIIQDILVRSGSSADLNGRGTHFILNRCPVCSKADKFYIDISSGKFICHNCVGDGVETKGNLLSLEMLLNGTEFNEAMDIVWGQNSAQRKIQQESNPFSSEFLKKMSEEKNDSPEKSVLADLKRVSLPEGSVKVAPGTKAWEYLEKSRGIPADTIPNLDVYHIPHEDAESLRAFLSGISDPEKRKESSIFSGRVIFAQRHRGRIVGYMGRDYAGRDKKYKTLNSSGDFRRLCLWNFEGAKNHERILVCEGIISAAKCGPSAVATYGVMITDEQINLLKTATNTKEIVIMCEVGAEAEAIKAAYKLSSFFKVKIANLPAVKAADGKSYLDCGDYDLDKNTSIADSADEVNPATLYVEICKMEKRSDREKQKSRGPKNYSNSNKKKLLKAFN